MKHRIGIYGLLFALTTSAANAQYIETFATPKLGGAWSFVLPGNQAGLNTENPGNYTITGNQFNVVMENTYGGGWRNAPSVVVAANAPSNYDLYYTLNFPVSNTSNYANAGLIIFTDAGNYFQWGTKHYAYNNSLHPNTDLYLSGQAVNGNDNFTGNQLASTTATYHLNKTGTTITFSVADGTNPETVQATVSSDDIDPYKAALYTFLSDLSGKHLGFYHDNNYSGDSTAIAYSNFSTTLPLALPKTTDPLWGPKLNPTWSFNFIGAQPYNEDASHFLVGNGVFVVTTQNSGLYSTNNNSTALRNSPSVTVNANAPSDYDIEAAVDVEFNNLSNSPNAGITVYTDVNNFFKFGSQYTSYSNFDYANTQLNLNGGGVGGFNNFATFQSVGPGPVLYRIKKTGSTISFSYTNPGGSEQVIGTASSTDTDTYKAGIYSLLSSLSGKHISLYNDPGFNGVVVNIGFSRFYTDLPLAKPLNFYDELFGSSLSAAWSFNVNGNNPGNTEDTNNYTVANGAFNVNFEGYSFPYANNVPSVTVDSNNSGDYWVETAIRQNTSGVNGYPFATLAIFDDVNNYFVYGLQHDAGSNTNYATSQLYTGGNFTGDLVADHTAVGINDNIVFRIVKTGTVITFSYLDGGNNERVIGTVSNASTGAQADAYSLLSSINGKHIGFLTSKTNASITEPVSFDYLRTSLNIKPPTVTVTGNFAIEGVGDLSAISAGAPLGNFHISFRTPGTKTEVYGSNVPVTVSSGGGVGTFSVSNVPVGTYDVNIKSPKNLSITDAGVMVVSGGTALPDNSGSPLGAGDSDNNNVVDTTDFNNLIGAFGNAYDPADPTNVSTGYDPTVDFDYNGVIDTGDFNLLVGEFGNSGN